MKPLVDFNSVREAFKGGEIHSATNGELETAVGTLANSGIRNENVRHEAIIMADAVHSILLRRLLDEQERRNQRTQFWFMILAAAGVASAIVQIFIALLYR